MSTHDEDRLSRSLHDRAGDMSGAPLGLADVQRSARGIRRRRRLAGGLVAAAVVAVAVPVVLNVTATPGADRPLAPASTSPSGTTTTALPAPTPKPRSSAALTTEGAAVGAAPAVTYLRDRTVVTTGAGQQDLPAAYDTVASYRGGWLAVERRDGTPYVVHLDAAGNVTSSKMGGDRIAVSQDGVEVSWVEGDKLYLDTTNGHSERPRSIDLPRGSADASPVGFVGPGSVVARVRAGVEPVYWVTDFASGQTLEGQVLAVRATDESNGVVGVQTSFDSSNGTSCWALRTNAGGDEEPKTCDWTIEAFSTDGAHFVGYPSGTDGLGSASVALLDAQTAEVVVRFDRSSDDAFVQGVVWEDGSHVVASLFEGGSWHLVRLGLDGTVEDLDSTIEDLDQLDRSPETSPLRFAARP